jgi:hypothetical protein
LIPRSGEISVEVMELLLNLFWITLALPAIWLWCQKPARAQTSWPFERLRVFVLLSCTLMLLFPVISATDDMRAMGQVLEESGSTERVVKQFAGGERSHSRLSGDGTLPVHLKYALTLYPNEEICGQVSVEPTLLPEQALPGGLSCRAPPQRFTA